jgi:hypothetical protein
MGKHQADSGNQQDARNSNYSQQNSLHFTSSSNFCESQDQSNHNWNGWLRQKVNPPADWSVKMFLMALKTGQKN